MVVLNDNHNTFQGVAMVLARFIPGVGYEGGLRLAEEVHRQGSAVVWSGMRELAELYWEQLSDSGLTMAPLSN